MAKNIIPKVGQDYAIYSVCQEWISFKVLSICNNTVTVQWTNGNWRNYAPILYNDNFFDQEGKNFHILELNRPEDLLIYQLKYSS